MKYSITVFFTFLCFSGFLACKGKNTLQKAETKQQRPNIIMILGDDHGYNDFGFMGSPHVLTPNLDKLAKESTLYPHAHVTASQCPYSLRTLLTGLYPYQFEYIIKHSLEKGYVRKNGQKYELKEIQHPSLPGAVPVANAIACFQTLPELLRKAGYASFEGGKFWEGSYDMAGFSEGMTDVNYADKQLNAKNASFHMPGGKGTKLARDSNAAVYDFIDRYRDSTFYIWYAPKLPHGPFDAADKYVDLYRNKGFSENAVQYYANVTRFDERMGELLDYIDKAGLRENTLIFYIADNGWDQLPHSNKRNERGKLTMHEKGYRTPLLFNWRGHIAAGRVDSGMVNSVDLFPTLLDYAGVEIPAYLPGRSLKPYLQAETPFPCDTLFGSAHFLSTAYLKKADTGLVMDRTLAFYLTTRDWHFIFDAEKNDMMLFDKKNDARENVNIAADYPDLTQLFLSQISTWRKKNIAPMQKRILDMESGQMQ